MKRKSQKGSSDGPKLNLCPTPSHNPSLNDKRLIQFVRAIAHLAAEQDFKAKKH